MDTIKLIEIMKIIKLINIDIPHKTFEIIELFKIIEMMKICVINKYHICEISKHIFENMWYV